MKKFNEAETLPKKNKFISLLVLLGIIFLISIVKDLFRPNNYQPLNLSPVDAQKDSLMSADEQTELIGKGKQLLSEMEDIEEEGDFVNHSSVKNVVLMKLDQIQQKPTTVPFPKRLLNKIKLVKS